MDRTFVAIKPDGVKRGLVGEIISLLQKYYDKDEAWFRRVGESSLKFWEENGKDAGEDLGTTNPVGTGCGYDLGRAKCG